MEKNNNIEELFKEAFDRFEVDPGDQLWSNIQSKIASPSAGSSASGTANQFAASATKAGGSWLTTVIVGGAIGVISIAGYYYFENKAESLKKENEIKQLDEIVNDNRSEKPAIENAQIEDNQNKNTSTQNSLIKEENGNNEQVDKAVSESKTKSKKPVIPAEPKTQEAQMKANSNASPSKGETAEKVEANTNSELASSNQKDLESKVESASTNSIPQNQNTDNSSGDLDAGDIEDADSKPNTSDPNAGGNILAVEPEKDVAAEIKSYKPANAFSPNGDGINDFFKVDLENIDALEMKIFNASGKIISEWNDIYGSWDGKTMNGSPAPEGTYFYQMVIKKEGKLYPKQGTITLTK